MHPTNADRSEGEGNFDLQKHPFGSDSGYMVSSIFKNISRAFQIIKIEFMGRPGARYSYRWARQITILRHSFIQTQKLLNTEPRGVPEDRQGSIR